MSNTDKELREEICGLMVGCSYEDLSTHDKQDADEVIALIHRHQNQLLDKLLEEVIGENETCYSGGELDCDDLIGECHHVINNRLRANQREAINKLRSK